jgi:hypothetical protein
MSFSPPSSCSTRYGWVVSPYPDGNMVSAGTFHPSRNAKLRLAHERHPHNPPPGCGIELPLQSTLNARVTIDTPGGRVAGG